jgi:hypothetical protein
VRRLIVILTVLAVLAAAFGIAWVSVGWPGLCEARGWCDPGFVVVHDQAHN